MRQRNKNRIWKRWLAVGISILQVICLPGLTAIAAPPADAAEAGYEDVYIQTFDVKPEELTEAAGDGSTHYSKWQDGSVSVYNAANSADAAMLALPEAYTQDGMRVALTLLENGAENDGTSHARMKVYLENQDGKRAHQFFVQRRNAAEGLAMLDSTNSLLGSDLKRSELGEPLRLEMEFNFTDGTIAYRTALLEGDSWSWSSWTAAKAASAKDGGSVLDSLAGIQFSNEYMACNITVDDIRISVPDGEEPDEPEPSAQPSTEPEPSAKPEPPVETEEPGYLNVYTEQFDAKPEELTDAATSEERYVRWRDGAVAAYNALGQSAADSAQLSFSETYVQGPVRLAMTVRENCISGAEAEHQRLKLFVLNSGGQRAHSIYIQRRNATEGLALLNTTNGIIDSGLKRSESGEPLRIEMEFDLEAQTVRYRTALAEKESWSWSAWTEAKQTLPTDSGAVLDGIAGLRFSNEYMLCNLMIDDVVVFRAKEKPTASNVTVTGYAGDVPRSGETLQGSYTYLDQYGDPESGSVYQWLVSDSADFAEFIVAGTGLTLTLDDSYFWKYVKFRVMPSNGIHIGDAADSDVVGPILTKDNTGTPPEVSALSISGGLYTGRTVTAQYQYFDLDLDVENGTEITWMTSSQPDTGFVSVQTAAVSDTDRSAAQYEIKQADADKYLRVSVTPKNQAAEGSTGKTVLYTTTEKIASDPVAADRDALDTGYASGSRISGDLYLVLKGENGSSITWESSNPDAIGIDGSVRRGAKDQDVTLTAHITLDGYTLTRTFTYTVAARQTGGADRPSGGGGGGTGFSRPQLTIDTETEKELSDAQPSAIPAPEIFTDLSEAEWARTYIETLAAKEIISGDGNGNFHPNRSITREELVKLAVEAYDKYDAEAVAAFSDVEADAWYSPYIASAVQEGIVQGYGDGRFGVGERITRQDMAVILCRAAGITPAESDTAVFTDTEEISDYAIDAVNALHALGILEGKEDGRFAPLDEATRAEAAKVIALLLAV